MQCGNCGYVGKETTRFCARCGQPLAAAAPASGSPEPPAPDPASAPPPAAPEPPSAWGTPAQSPPPPPAATPASGPPSAPTPPSPYAPPAPYAASGENPYSPPPAQFGGPPPPQPPPPGYGYGYPGYAVQHTNGLAIASLVLGIGGWIFCGLGSVLAIVLGAVSLSQIRSSGGRETGEGMAKAGIILGIVFVALTVLWFVFLVVSSSSNSSM